MYLVPDQEERYQYIDNVHEAVGARNENDV